MPGDPVVLILGAHALTLSSGAAPAEESSALHCHCVADETDLAVTLAEVQPDVLVTIGDLAHYPTMHQLPFHLRARWLHYEDLTDTARIGREAWACYLAAALRPRQDVPLVSVFTATYNTRPAFLHDAYWSLCRQTYGEWEWVILDDGSDAPATQEYLERILAGDPRVRLVRAPHRGCVGAVKRDAALLGYGSLLVELDHDDTLAPGALAAVAAAFEAHPAAGFVYSDFVMRDESGNQAVSFGDTWAFGYGESRREGDRLVHGTPINALTIRHIVGAPNHLRAWRRSCYLTLGGHNPALSIVDDYELVVRTFLATQMVRIPAPLYTQHMGQTTTESRRPAIQRLVRAVAAHYDAAIHARLLALGMDDCLWDERLGRANWALWS